MRHGWIELGFFAVIFVMFLSGAVHALDLNPGECIVDVNSSVRYCSKNVTCENVTVVNESVYNITNCTYTDMVQYLQNYTAGIDKNLNFSFLYTECRVSRDTCVKELGVCSKTVDSLDDVYMLKNESNSIMQGMQDRIFLLQSDLKKADDTSWYRAGGASAVVAAILYGLFIYRPSLQKTDRTQSRSDVPIDSKLIERDAEIAQLRQRLEESRGTQKKGRRK